MFDRKRRLTRKKTLTQLQTLTLDIILVSGTILLICVAFSALGLCPNFHDPFVQQNIKLLIVSPLPELPHHTFIYSENYSVSLGA